MKNFFRGARVWIFGTMVGFYTTFVLQTLWNWFLAGSLHASEISYWQMYGLNMLLLMVLERDTFVEEDHWKRALIMLLACIPPHRKEEVDEALNEENEGIWLKAGSAVFGKLIGNTVTLGIGWAVHSFLI